MPRLRIFGIAAIACMVAIGIGLAVGQVFGTKALLIREATAVATVVSQTKTEVPAPTGVSLSPTDAIMVPTPAQALAPTASASAPTDIPAPISPPPATATPEPSYIEHTVQKGDILYTIAKQYNVTIEEILAINDIAEPQSLMIGQVIHIPKK